MKLLILMVISLINLEAYTNNKMNEADSGAYYFTLKTINVNIIEEKCGVFGLTKRIILEENIKKNFNIIFPKNPLYGLVHDPDRHISIEGADRKLKFKTLINGKERVLVLGNNASEDISVDGSIYNFSGNLSEYNFNLNDSCKHELKSIEVYVVALPTSLAQAAFKLSKQAEKYREDRVELSNRLTSQAIEIASLEKTKIKLMKYARSILVELSHLQEKISAKDKKIEELKDQISVLNEDSPINSKISTELVEAKAKLNELTDSFIEKSDEFKELVRELKELNKNIVGQSLKLKKIISTANTVCLLRRVVASTIVPQINNMKNYDARYLKGELQAEKLIYIDD